MDLSNAIKNSFPKLEKLFTKAELAAFAAAPDCALEQWQHGVGALVRLHLLRPDRARYKRFAEAGIESPHAMTAVLLAAFHARLQSTGQ